MRPENIHAWAEGVECGHPPPLQPPFDQFGDLLPNTPKTGPSKLDAEAYLNYFRKQNAAREALERVSRQQKILFPNAFGAKDRKPEPIPYRIPRKPVPNSNDTTPRPPQVVLLRNGETKTLARIPTYAERVRDLGYPEALCPLPMTEVAAENTRGDDCTGAKVVKEKDDRQICHRDQKLNTQGYSDGGRTAQNPALMPETSSLSGEALALRPAQAANPGTVPKATAALQRIGKPPTADSNFIDENEMRRPSACSNLSRSNAARRPSNSVFERMAVPTDNVKHHDNRKG